MELGIVYTACAINSSCRQCYW